MMSGDCAVVVHGNQSDHCDQSDTLPSMPCITKSSARKRCAQFPIWNTCACAGLRTHTHPCMHIHARLRAHTQNTTLMHVPSLTMLCFVIVIVVVLWGVRAVSYTHLRAHETG